MTFLFYFYFTINNLHNNDTPHTSFISTLFQSSFTHCAVGLKTKIGSPKIIFCDLRSLSHLIQNENGMSF